MTTGIVLKTYPKLSETFILGELLGLEREGHSLRIFSLQAPTDEKVNPETAQVEAPVTYVPTRPVRSAMAEASRHPLRFAMIVARSLRSGEAGWVTQVSQAAWLASEARELELSSLHAHFISQPASVADAAASLSGLPFSISAHAKDIYLSTERSLRGKMKRARFVVTCTEHNRDHLVDLSPDPSRIRGVHHGVNLDLLKPDTAKAANPSGEPPLILGVGRLRPKKGFDQLVEACALLRDRGLDFRCRIVGYGPEESNLENQIDRLDLGDRIELLGKRTRAEVIEQYRAAAVLVQPCRILPDGDRDGIPNVLLEAMAMKLPVVTTNVSGIPELVEHGVTGLLVEPDQADAVADQVQFLLQDITLASRLGDAARAKVESDFTMDRSVKQISELLHPPTVGYVLKGFPRLSEIFIASEVHRMEALGFPLRLFVLKPADEDSRHEVVSRIRAVPEYSPPLTSISKSSAIGWVRSNWSEYGQILGRTAARNPRGFLSAAGMAAAQSVRARRGWRPRKVYLKEFFQAAAIADRVGSDKNLRHLHAHFGHGATTVTWLAARMTGKTFSFTAHAKDIYREELNPAGLLSRKMRAAEFVATCTGANHRHLCLVEPEAAVHRIYHGLNDDFSRLLEAGPPPEAPRSQAFSVLAVGRLVPKKGLDLLIRACAKLVEHGLDCRVRIVGESGEHEETLRALITSLGVEDRVELLESMTQRELFSEYQRNDVFCLPCRVLDDGDRDGIPNVLMEAMASGLPVVSTPVSGIPELVEHRANGILVEPENADALSKALLELADDVDLGRRLGIGGQATVAKRFDAVTEAKQLLGLLQTAANR